MWIQNCDVVCLLALAAKLVHCKHANCTTIWISMELKTKAATTAEYKNGMKLSAMEEGPLVLTTTLIRFRDIENCLRTWIRSISCRVHRAYGNTRNTHRTTHTQGWRYRLKITPNVINFASWNDSCEILCFTTTHELRQYCSRTVTWVVIKWSNWFSEFNERAKNSIEAWDVSGNEQAILVR